MRVVIIFSPITKAGQCLTGRLLLLINIILVYDNYS